MVLFFIDISSDNPPLAVIFLSRRPRHFPRFWLDDFFKVPALFPQRRRDSLSVSPVLTGLGLRFIIPTVVIPRLLPVPGTLSPRRSGWRFLSARRNVANIFLYSLLPRALHPGRLSAAGAAVSGPVPAALHLLPDRSAKLVKDRRFADWRGPRSRGHRSLWSGRSALAVILIVLISPGRLGVRVAPGPGPGLGARHLQVL